LLSWITLAEYGPGETPALPTGRQRLVVERLIDGGERRAMHDEQQGRRKNENARRERAAETLRVFMMFSLNIDRRWPIQAHPRHAV
jgi:hypothetical protein